ncbi:hypothetical protein [Rhizobium sp. G21]|uniref:hypothetical protein n=1 Tax=Rhizobium sp. G21 TaxID=2758439 RepID=UPI001602EA9F|nr:hypothetical protein [Rhizobium sp. G21]MBB1247817.1 hypothetical protein [Rhizobium sp. G21]
MSFHFSAHEILEALGLVQKQAEQHALPPQLNDEEELLLACYRSGQIGEWAWSQHVAEHPALASR